MNRRSFLQSMAAAFSATAIGIRPNFAQTPPQIRYDLFTDTQSFRYATEQPFSLDAAIYATDSRLLVTHPGEWSGDASGKVPDVSRLWWDEFDEPGWKELPEQRLELRRPPIDTLCHHCMGTGRLGDGIYRVSDLDEDCDPCFRWTGGTKCGWCDNGYDTSFSHQERIGGAVFCPGRMNRLRTLGGLDYRLIDAGARYEKDSRVMLLRGDSGIKAMLMSMAE